MKKYLGFLILVLVFALPILACGAPAAVLNKFEKGDIAFVNPADGSLFHDFDVTILPVEITINSTFESQKVATLSLDGVPWINCTLEGFGRNTVCPVATIQTTGFHTLAAQVEARDTVVNIQTTLTWTPWSPLEQGMSRVAGIFGQNDPKLGFNIVGLVISAIAAIIIAKLTGGSQMGVVLGGIVVVVGLFYWAPPEVTQIFVESIYGIVIGYFLVLIARSMHFFHARRADGASVTYLGPGGETGGRMVDSIGKHGNQLMGPPPYQQTYYPDDGIQRTRIPARGVAGLIGRIIGRD